METLKLFFLLSVEIKAGHFLQTTKAAISETELASTFISAFPASTAIGIGFHEVINGTSVITGSVNYLGGPSRRRS